MKSTQQTNMPEASQAESMHALEAAMDNCGCFVLSYFRKLTHDVHQAEDLAQELWIDVFQKFKTHQFQHLRLLHRRAFQIFLDNLRKAKVRSFVEFAGQVPDGDGSLVYAEPGSPAEEKALRERFWERFHGVALSELQKEAFFLYARYGYTLAELEAHLHVPSSTLHDWIGRAKTILKEFIQKEPA